MTNPSTEPPRYVVVYAAAVGSLLSTGLHAARDALLTTPKTLDPPAAEPLELGGALVAAVEVGVLAKELLRPSPRHFYVLNGEAGEIVFSAPEGDDLRATLVDPALAIASSKAFASKLVGTATGLVHKLRGLSVPRMARKAARKGPKVEPSAAQLLKVLPRADILAHCELCQSWFKLATNSRSSTSDHLQELREGVAVALEPDVHASPIGPVLDQWLAAAAGAASAATETKSTAAAEEVERTAKSRAAVAGWLLALRDADLHTFAAGHPAAQAANAASNVGSINQEPSVRLQSLLQTLDPHSRLPPHQIVFAVQSGSAMYNLATTASDEDYLLVFAASPGELLGFEPPADQIEFKGEMIGFGEDKGGIVEGSAMVSTLTRITLVQYHFVYTKMCDDLSQELGRYVSLLCKGNPMVLEPLFVASDSAVHSSSVWHELQAMRRRCLFTRRAARQYLGFVEDRLRKAQKALEVEDEIKAASKYLYHGMHKLMQLRSILAGDEPRIYLSSDGDSESDHGRIMRVRQCVRVDLAGAEELQTARAEQLLRTELQAATEELAQLKEGSFDASVESFPEEIDFEALGEWLLSIRAIIYRHQIANSANAVDDNGEILSRQSSLPSIAPALLPRQISSGSDHISADDSGEDNDSNHDKDDGQYVCSVLSQFQREERVRLVYAAERSSHSYGWAHSDSDHDIFAIFVCDRREYFGLTSLRRAASREYPEANGQCAVGVYAWELKHACKLALASNPTMLDGLRSPCVYVDLLQSETSSDSPADTWGQRMLRTALVRYDQRALAQSYLAHAKKDLREQVRRAGPEGPKRKKCVRSLVTTGLRELLGILVVH